MYFAFLYFVFRYNDTYNGSGIHKWTGSGKICSSYVGILGLTWQTKTRRLAKDAFRSRRDSQESRSSFRSHHKTERAETRKRLCGKGHQVNQVLSG
jgi:hypothetical protein